MFSSKSLNHFPLKLQFVYGFYKREPLVSTQFYSRDGFTVKLTPKSLAEEDCTYCASVNVKGESLLLTDLTVPF